MVNAEIIWHTEKKKIKDLKPFESNPRKFTEKQKGDLTKSLERFNLAEPIVINTDGTIIGGHFRLKILKEKLGEDAEIDVRVPNRKLTNEEVKELNLRLNKNLGEWDWDLLATFDEEMLKDVGFSSEELDEIFELEIDEEFDVEKELNRVLASKERRCKEGDLWQLGEHRLYIGDATKKESWEKVLRGEKIDMIFTDPPYGINYKGRGKKTSLLKIPNDEKGRLSNLLQKAFSLAYEFSNDWCVAYIFHTDQKEDIDIIFKKEFTKAGFFLAGKIIWVKDKPSMGWNDYRYQYEPILYGWKKKHRFYGGRKETNVWNFPVPKGEREHLTPKPVELIQKAIKNSSKRGEIVVDCFGGSGSTLIGCEIMKRKCRMIEIEPIYGEVILTRWEKFTGQTAKKLN